MNLREEEQELGLNKGDEMDIKKIKENKMKIREAKQNKLIEKNTKIIVDAVLKEIENYERQNEISLRRIFLPFYLNGRKLIERHVKGVSPFVYNSAIGRSLDVLTDLRKSNEQYTWEACSCEPEGAETTREDYLFIDVPRIVYGAK